MLQFASDVLPDEYAKVQRVRGWMLRQCDNWRFSWEEVKRCRDDFAREDGARMRLRPLWQRFNDLGYTLCANWDKIRKEMLNDEKKECI